MEAADTPQEEQNPVQYALSSQGATHNALFESNCYMTQQVSELARQISVLTSSSSPAVPFSTITLWISSTTSYQRLTDLEPFRGDLNKCRGFLLQCDLGSVPLPPPTTPQRYIMSWAF